ncbi:SRPBCC family protein [Nocardioides panacisoli]|uniref:SRPBCC family protein n=1 Tax=Nocardioides panacisoli TaxID=627624 RepID=A0ABP7HXG5_9ACTN
MQTTSTATVSATPDQVWSVLCDHEGMAHWGPGLKVSLRKEGTGDRNGVGAVREINAPGPAPAIVEEITAFEPGRKLGYRALGGVPLRNYSGEVVLSPSGAVTTIAYTVSADSRIPVLDRIAVAGISKVLLTALVRRVRAVAS